MKDLKLGDVVYTLRRGEGLRANEISIILLADKIPQLYVCERDSSELDLEFSVDDVGKTVFLTREEAIESMFKSFTLTEV